ncbi:unnamed protein product [Bursaphelenchus xylophilus]|uniref:(pine wood nematode) hypothetical protein n=1 Tax=Bursaphelenchus xylophilus TaxID=6326 RepID=A0A811LW90_BURXY|nr:unnamed protein product [Bursaphelenchus xylophilus]CAG9124608.1 unnamed protein product [Bursaphelenchus xylophilus]
MDNNGSTNISNAQKREKNEFIDDGKRGLDEGKDHILDGRELANNSAVGDEDRGSGVVGLGDTVIKELIEYLPA